MRPGLFRIVTFATTPTGGNPAWVLVSDEPSFPERGRELSRDLGGEMVAELRRAGDNLYDVAFFLPGGSHPGAGHAMQAAAHHVLGRSQEVTFRRAGEAALVARRGADGRVEVDWPTMPYRQTDDRNELASALGSLPVETYTADFGHVAVFAEQKDIAELSPDLAAVETLERNAVICTAPGQDSDIVIRVFAPKLNLPEDPVCGTAHRIIVPFWAARFNQEEIRSRHLSARGGELVCRVGHGVVSIGGTALTVEERPHPGRYL